MRELEKFWLEPDFGGDRFFEDALDGLCCEILSVPQSQRSIDKPAAVGLIRFLHDEGWPVKSVNGRSILGELQMLDIKTSETTIRNRLTRLV
jgi:hypothetical protein